MKRKDKERLQTAIIGGATYFGVFLTRKLLENYWEKTTDREPPSDPADPSNSWKEVLTWAVVTGVLASLTNVLISRGLTAGTDRLLDK